MPPLTPRVVVNFKTYPEATGRRAVALARSAAKLEKRFAVGVVVAPQAVDVRACVEAGARVYAQHFDEVESSASTGATRWESLIDAGVEGSLLNHSERRIHPSRLPWHVERVRRAGLASLVCAHHDAEARTLSGLRPTMIAVEPPELIGGDVSVTTADPEIVRRSVQAVHEKVAGLPVLCGAGVKDGRDVAKAIELGAHGVLVASGVVKAEKPEKVLLDLVRAAEAGHEARKKARPKRRL